jgi:hypothetical protein
MYYRIPDAGIIKNMRGASDFLLRYPKKKMKFVLRFAKDDDWGMSDLTLRGTISKSHPATGRIRRPDCKDQQKELQARVKFSLMGQESLSILGINVVKKKV